MPKVQSRILLYISLTRAGPGQLSRVGLVARLKQQQAVFLLSSVSTPNLVPTHPPIQCITRDLSPGVDETGCEGH